MISKIIGHLTPRPCATMKRVLISGMQPLSQQSLALMRQQL
jgi:hypothetical protein